jgi:hypothetical protein
MLLQVSGEGADRGGILAVSHEQHLRTIEVDEERLALPPGPSCAAMEWLKGRSSWR